MQEPEPLGGNFLDKKIDAGRVSVRPRKAGDQTKPDRVVADAKDDRNRDRRSFGRLGSIVSSGRGDHGHATADQVGHEFRQTTELALPPVVLDHHVPALDVAGFAEAFAERSRIARGGIGRPTVDEADDRQRRLLRPRREWPHSRRAAEQCDECAPFHSITSSARASSIRGISDTKDLCRDSQCPVCSTALSTLPPAVTGLAATCAKATMQGAVPSFTQLWMVPRCTSTSPALRCTLVPSSCISISPEITVA